MCINEVLFYEYLSSIVSFFIYNLPLSSLPISVNQECRGMQLVNCNSESACVVFCVLLTPFVILHPVKKSDDATMEIVFQGCELFQQS